MLPSLPRRAIVELLGTFILVFTGTGAVVVNDATGAITHPGIALTFGLVVLALIYTIGDLSGCHINPAVTLGFVAARRFTINEALHYIPAQFLGAVAASVLLALLFPANQKLGGTFPNGPEWRSFILEVFLTWFLMLAVLCISTGSKEKGITAGIAIGSIIALEALFAGPICGASMNPARSFGPALVSGELAKYPIYLAAPVLGALLAVPTFALIQNPRSEPSA
jgi:aquaporin Z